VSFFPEQPGSAAQQPEPSLNQGVGQSCSSPQGCQPARNYGQSYSYQPAANHQFCTPAGYKAWAESLGFTGVSDKTAESMMPYIKATFGCG
jgi:hypothetical protein